jgi:hypothetical protein
MKMSGGHPSDGLSGKRLASPELPRLLVEAGSCVLNPSAA